MLPLLFLVLVGSVQSQAGQDLQDIAKLLIPLLDDVVEINQKHTQEKLSPLKTSVVDQANKLRAQEKRTDQLVYKNEYTIAFMAGYECKSALKINDVIQFTDVKLNTGNLFNKETGVFTVPVHGLYYFELFAMTSAFNTEVLLSIVVNDKKVSTLYAFDKYFFDQASVGCNVILQQGQWVKAVVHHLGIGTKNLFAYPYTGFLGHLVKAI